MKVVFDTNVLVSALVFPGGRGEEALRRIVDELLGVLARKFSRSAEELAHVAVFISELATTARPGRRLKVLRDAPDNRILECAVAGRADAIVTGDHAILALREFQGIRLLSLRDYLGNAP